MTKKNALSLELCHEWSKADKAKYNAEYYRTHKQYWQNYYKDHVGTTYDTRTGKEIKPTLDMMNANANPAFRRELARDAINRADKAKNSKAYRAAMDEYHRQLGNEYIEQDISNMYDAMASGEWARRAANEKAAGVRAPQAMMKTPTKSERVKNKAKQKAQKISKATSSAASTVGTKAHKLGKDFVSMWKSGVKGF